MLDGIVGFAHSRHPMEAIHYCSPHPALISCFLSAAVFVIPPQTFMWYPHPDQRGLSYCQRHLHQMVRSCESWSHFSSCGRTLSDYESERQIADTYIAAEASGILDCYSHYLLRLTFRCLELKFSFGAVTQA